MEFKYDCFISYRNGKQTDDLLNSFAEELHDALESEFAAYVDGKPEFFYDKLCLEEGMFIVNEIKRALRNSIFMLLIYTPNYLGGSLYCASELYYMLEVEKKRLEKLSEKGVADVSMIIPIILRGEVDDLPEILTRNGRLVNEDFAKFALHQVTGRKLKETEEYGEVIRKFVRNVFYSCHEKVRSALNEHDDDDLHGSIRFLDPNNSDDYEVLKAFVKSRTIKSSSNFPSL